MSSARELEGQVAIVTGATKGIGRAIARALAVGGANVVAVARTSSVVEPIAEEIRAAGARFLPVAADVTEDESLERIVDESLEAFGRIDILVNNAAMIHHNTDLVDFDAALWRQVIETNLVSAALLTKAVLPTMIERRSGKVINIASIGGRRGGRQRTAYRASKAGLINLTESVAAEVKPYGIDVNCICPGGVDTEGFWEAFPADGTKPNLMSVSEIAELAFFLASRRSSAITGATIDAFGPSNPLFNS